MTDTAAPAPVRRNRSSGLPWISTPVLALAFVVCWQFYVSETHISAFILPAPAAVWTAWLELLQSPRAWGHAETTVYETLVGFAWGLFIGVGLGVLIGRIRWLEMTLNPFIVAIQVVPKVAFIPLFVVWFGFGITSKVIVSAVLAFFPILTNTVLGVKSVETSHRDVMTSLNSSRLAVFWRLELPSALPYILTGMEIGVVLAIIGAIVGEYLGGNSGLGYLLISKMNAFETDGLFAVMIHMTILGFAFYFAVGFLRRLLIPWHQSSGIDSGT
ncbi:MAG TPA: ABC transporter permease [Stellaceae bacterium]|nr:ABC transporter permease [Stellaceae bacterium]